MVDGVGSNGDCSGRFSFRNAPVMTELMKHKDLIGSWLSEPNITYTQIQRLLAAEGVLVSERSINHFINLRFPRLPKHTVHLTTELGMKAQVDFGYVGMMKDR